jgi:hypothetical protein
MNNIGVFIDSENISHIDIPSIMLEIKKYGRIIVNRVYADWTINFTENWKNLIILNGLEPIHCPKIPRKNSIDIKIIDDIYDILYFRQTVDTYILVSNDIDYLTCARKIKLYGKSLVVFGYDNCSEMLKNTSDEFVNISLINIGGRIDNKIYEEQLELENVFDEEMGEDISKKYDDDFLNNIFEIMNNEKHLNMATLKHRIKKRIEKLDEYIKKKYNNYFIITKPIGKKKKIYNITSINSDVHKTILEQFIAIFQLCNTNELLLTKFNEKLSLIINNFDYKLWGFNSFKEMIQTLFNGKLDIINNNNYQYIVNLTS